MSEQLQLSQRGVQAVDEDKDDLRQHIIGNMYHNPEYSWESQVALLVEIQSDHEVAPVARWSREEILDEIGNLIDTGFIVLVRDNHVGN